jgi:hypothetical protein
VIYHQLFDRLPPLCCIGCRRPQKQKLTLTVQRAAIHLEHFNMANVTNTLDVDISMGMCKSVPCKGSTFQPHRSCRVHATPYSPFETFLFHFVGHLYRVAFRHGLQAGLDSAMLSLLFTLDHASSQSNMGLTSKAGDLQGMTVSLPKHRYAGLDESNPYGLPSTLSKSGTEQQETSKLGNYYYNSGTLQPEQDLTGQQTTQEAQGFYYKGTLKQTEAEENPASQIQSSTGAIVLSEEEKLLEKSYLRKADIRIVPLFGFLYLMAVMTRSNIGAAKVAGLEAALGLTPTDFANATSFFYLGYILFQIPSNMMLKIVSPARWFPIVRNEIYWKLT